MEGFRQEMMRHDLCFFWRTSLATGQRMDHEGTKLE